LALKAQKALAQLRQAVDRVDGFATMLFGDA
jgi:hypothetical protein